MYNLNMIFDFFVIDSVETLAEGGEMGLGLSIKRLGAADTDTDKEN